MKNQKQSTNSLSQFAKQIISKQQQKQVKGGDDIVIIEDLIVG